MVVVRLTHNGWQTCKDVDAKYFCSDSEMERDHFTFTLLVEEFAICYVLEGKQNWDNAYAAVFCRNSKLCNCLGIGDVN